MKRKEYRSDCSDGRVGSDFECDRGHYGGG